MENQDFTVTIDDKEYKFSELSDNNKAIVNQIRDIESQQMQLNFKFDQLEASKTFFSQSLIANVNTDSESEASQSSSDEPSDSE